MLKRFLTVAILGLILGSGAICQANAASFTPMSGLDQQISNATGGSTITPAGGPGWWAVPVVVGGVILYHEYRRHHRYCYRHCWWRHGHRHCAYDC